MVSTRSGRAASGEDQPSGSSAPAAAVRTTPTPAPTVNSPGVLQSIFPLFSALLKAIVKSVFAFDSSRTALSRSSVFLIVFVTVHLLGNCTLFKNDGGVAFNLYGYALHSNPILPAIEAYLACGFVVHVAAAMWLTKKDRKYTSFERAQLAISGTFLGTFLAVHLADFRFGGFNKTVRQALPAVFGVTEPVEVKDIYSLTIQLFSSEWKCVIYTLGVLALGLHLSAGWNKLVAKPAFGLDSKFTKPAMVIGQFLTFAVVATFAVLPAWCYFVLRPVN